LAYVEISLHIRAQLHSKTTNQLNQLHFVVIFRHLLANDTETPL